MLKKLFSSFLFIAIIAIPTMAIGQNNADAGVTYLYLIRHGQTDWNAQDRAQGHSDIPLNEKGQQQAAQAGAKLASWNIGPINAIYSSDLQRAAHTAKLIAEKVDFTQEIPALPDMKERNLGAAEGTTKAERDAQWGDVRKELDTLYTDLKQRWDHTEYPGSETNNEVAKRVTSCLTALMEKHKDQNVIVTSHGGSIYCFGQNNGMAIDKVPNCAIVILLYHHETKAFELVGVEKD